MCFVFGCTPDCDGAHSYSTHTSPHKSTLLTKTWGIFSVAINRSRIQNCTCIGSAFASGDEETKGLVGGSGELQEEGPVGGGLGHLTDGTHRSGYDWHLLHAQTLTQLNLGTGRTVGTEGMKLITFVSVFSFGI